MFHQLIDRLLNRRKFVIIDPNDSSVTLSRALFSHIRRSHRDITGEPKVFMFYIPAAKAYGFTLRVPEQTTQLASIQYNTKHRCIGFETLNPTVAKILYDYGVPTSEKPCRLTVSPCKTTSGLLFYRIERPSSFDARKNKTEP